jgi:hypothetical protein
MSAAASKWKQWRNYGIGSVSSAYLRTVDEMVAHRGYSTTVEHFQHPPLSASVRLPHQCDHTDQPTARSSTPHFRQRAKPQGSMRTITRRLTSGAADAVG